MSLRILGFGSTDLGPRIRIHGIGPMNLDHWILDPQIWARGFRSTDLGPWIWILGFGSTDLGPWICVQGFGSPDLDPGIGSTDLGPWIWSHGFGSELEIINSVKIPTSEFSL